MTRLSFTAKNVNGPQLGTEIATALVVAPPAVGYADGSLVVDGQVAGKQAQVQTVIDAHVPDSNWGVPQEDTQMAALRSKARDVFNQTDTFTATQLQRILAMLVLKETR